MHTSLYQRLSTVLRVSLARYMPHSGLHSPPVALLTVSCGADSLLSALSQPHNLPVHFLDFTCLSRQPLLLGINLPQRLLQDLLYLFQSAPLVSHPSLLMVDVLQLLVQSLL